MLPELYQHYPNKILTIWIYVTKPITFDINEAGTSSQRDRILVSKIVDTQFNLNDN